MLHRFLGTSAVIFMCLSLTAATPWAETSADHEKRLRKLEQLTIQQISASANDREAIIRNGAAITGLAVEIKDAISARDDRQWAVFLAMLAAIFAGLVGHFRVVSRIKNG